MAQRERWEIIERWVFVTLGIAMACASLWLLVEHRSQPGRIAGAILLIPCTFWVFWQLFHEDKLGSQAHVGGAERAMYRGWLWVRRVVLGAVSLVLAAGAIATALLDGPLAASAVLAVFAVVAGWVAAYGGGRVQSFGDDVAVHRERARRYDR
ncbi:hypothetical protein [Roseateles sp.]|uniref:hypothetical protein n=1 Tax=Roseateles sp. TaxID=1971397 RepID=UPI002F3E6435